MRHIGSYTFIDASHLLVLFPSAVGSFPGHPGRRPDLIRIYRIQGEPVGHVATLQLPQDLELTTMLNPSVPCPPTPPSSAAFWPDPERRIVVLRLLSWYSPFHTIIRMLRPSISHWSWHNMLLMIPCTTFHEQIKRASSTQDSDSTPASSIPWEEWGLRGSVLIRQDNFENTQRTGNWLSPSVFPYGSRLSFFAPSSGGGSSSPQLVTLDANPLSKLHPPHPGCTRRDALASVEKSSDRGLSSILKTTHPRTYYFRPSFPDFDQAFGISQSASGYVVFVSPAISLSWRLVDDSSSAEWAIRKVFPHSLFCDQGVSTRLAHQGSRTH